MRHTFRATMLAPVAMLLAAVQTNAKKMARRITQNGAWKHDEAAVIELGPLLSTAAIIVGAVVAIILVAALLPTYLGAITDASDALENGTTGNDTADSLLPIFGLLVAFGGLFAIVGLIFLAIRLKKGK
jgi:hypothetical protein